MPRVGIEDIPLWEWPWGEKKQQKENPDVEPQIIEECPSEDDASTPLVEATVDLEPCEKGNEVFEVLVGGEGMGLTVDERLVVEGVRPEGNADMSGLGLYKGWQVVRCNGEIVGGILDVKNMIKSAPARVSATLELAPPTRPASASGGGTGLTTTSASGGTLTSPLRSFHTTYYDVSPLSSCPMASPVVSPSRWRPQSPAEHPTTIRIQPA